MINNYEKYNESRSRRRGNKINSARGGYNNNIKRDSYNNNIKIEENDYSENQNLFLSQRLESIIKKISETGDLLSKEILDSIDNKSKFFDVTYLDISKNLDNFSFFTKEEVNKLGIVDNTIDTYKSNKRFESKIYKIVKILFGNKFTKKEIQKFISIYKSVYSKGPDKKNVEQKALTNEDVINKIIEDTTNGKLKWVEVPELIGLEKYRSVVNITKSKYLQIELYLFTNQDNDFLTLNLRIEKINKFIKSINFNKSNIVPLSMELKKIVSKK